MSTTLRIRILAVLLRLGGATMLLALGAVFLPADRMAAVHAWLGLGEFPRAAVVDYLTRSISALYAIHGGLLLVLATDVRRFAPLVRYLAAANVLFGLLLLGIDLHAGLPAYWTLTEGPPVAAFGAVLWALLPRSPDTRAAGPTALEPDEEDAV